MAASAASQTDQDHLKCAICSEQFKEPKVLPCLHYFCKRCLEGLLTQGEGDGEWKVVCPKCCEETKISDGQIESLPANFFLNNLFSLMALQGDSSVGRNIKCENCDDDDPPVIRCTTCNQFLCEICTAAHKRGRKTKNHSLLSLDEVRKAGPSAAVEAGLCKEHTQKDLKYYCEECASVICSECPMANHQGHKYVHVKDAFAKAEEEVKKHLEETKTKELILKDAIESIIEMKKRVEATGDKTLVEVSECFDRLIGVLETRRQTMVDDIAKLKGSKLEALQTQLSDLEMALGNARSSIEFTEKTLKDGDEVQMLAMKKLIEEQLKKLNSVTWKLEPCKDHVIRFKTNGKLMTISADLPTFGFISDIQACPRKSTITMDNGQESVVYNTLWKQPVKFTINAKDRNGLKQNDGGDAFTVEVVNPAVNPNENLPLDVKDDGNGTYTSHYTPREAGQYLLSVKIRGSHVQGSPFTWTVEKWNLIKLWNPQDSTLSDENMTVSSRKYGSYYTAGSVGLSNGYHSWKVRCASMEFGFGIIDATQRNGTCIQNNKGNHNWTLHEGKKCQPSFGDKTEPSTVSRNSYTTSVFEVYLHCNDSKLIICDHQTKQQDTWCGFKGEVFPFFFTTCRLGVSATLVI